MAIKVFFTFHYEQELWRARIIRQAWIDQGGQALGFWDEAAWQRARSSERHLALIDQAVHDAEVTAVLITRGTSDQGYIQYAVCKSHQTGKGLLAIYMHNIPDAQGTKALIGDTHFGEIERDANGNRVFFWQRYPTYRWVIEDGPQNLRPWIDHADAALRRTRKAVTDA
jgi:hypothetical protein